MPFHLWISYMTLNMGRSRNHLDNQVHMFHFQWQYNSIQFLQGYPWHFILTWTLRGWKIKKMVILCGFRGEMHDSLRKNICLFDHVKLAWPNFRDLGSGIVWYNQISEKRSHDSVIFPRVFTHQSFTTQQHNGHFPGGHNRPRHKKQRIQRSRKHNHYLGRKSSGASSRRWKYKHPTSWGVWKCRSNQRKHRVQ